MTISLTLQLCSVAAAALSASAWFRSASVKIGHDEMMRIRKRRAEKKIETPNYAGASLDGWDMSETFAAQSRWNMYGAGFAGLSVLLQSLAPFFF